MQRTGILKAKEVMAEPLHKFVLAPATLLLLMPIVSSHTLALESSSQVKQNSTVEDKIDVNRPVLDKWALVVGISKFKDDKINLKYAAKDAKDFARFLITNQNFSEDHVLLLTDEKATRANVLGALGSQWLPRLANPNDLVVLYFSSHGSPAEADIGGVNYLIAHDTDLSNLYATGIPLQDLIRMIKARVHSDRVVIFRDACHSGATSAEGKGIYRVGNFDADTIAQGTGQMVISSSQPSERSWESKNEDNGVFTYHLMKALEEKGTDTTIGEAFDTLKENVETEVLRDRATLQSPVMKSKWQGADLIIGAKPVKPRESLVFEPTESVRQSDLQTEKKHYGVDGEWQSNWGKVTIEHPSIKGDESVKISGYWYQAEKKQRGVIRSGTYDPKTRSLKFNYWQSWNLSPGKATFKLSEDGTRLEGNWKHFGLAGGEWTMWREASGKTETKTD